MVRRAVAVHAARRRLVAAALGRLPRFIAKAALWRVTVARPFLALAGVLPVYRTGDGDRAMAGALVSPGDSMPTRSGAMRPRPISSISPWRFPATRTVRPSRQEVSSVPTSRSISSAGSR